MQCLTFAECAAWCVEHGYPVNPSDPYGRPAPAIEDHFDIIYLKHPTDSGEKVALARDVIQFMAQGDALLWVRQWDVWPSSQHMPLFRRFREALGERRPMIEAPGHLARPGELDDALSVLATALLFVWDCHVFSTAHAGTAFVCSHDEWCAIYVAEGTDEQPIQAALERWLSGDNARDTAGPFRGRESK